VKLIHIGRPLAEKHYAEHKCKGFYEGLVDYITSCPVIAAVFEGTNAVSVVRATIGSTDPAAAAPGTIRADFGLERGRNLVHASDSPKSAVREIKLFFRPSEVAGWDRDTDRWIFE